MGDYCSYDGDCMEGEVCKTNFDSYDMMDDDMNFDTSTDMSDDDMNMDNYKGSSMDMMDDDMMDGGNHNFLGEKNPTNRYLWTGTSIKFRFEFAIL